MCFDEIVVAFPPVLDIPGLAIDNLRELDLCLRFIAMKVEDLQ